MRFFERIDALERELQRQKEINAVLQAHLDADLERLGEPAARMLAERLREVIKR